MLNIIVGLYHTKRKIRLNLANIMKTKYEGHFRYNERIFYPFSNNIKVFYQEKTANVNIISTACSDIK